MRDSSDLMNSVSTSSYRLVTSWRTQTALTDQYRSRVSRRRVWLARLPHTARGYPLWLRSVVRSSRGSFWCGRNNEPLSVTCNVLRLFVTYWTYCSSGSTGGYLLLKTTHSMGGLRLLFGTRSLFG